jgi:cyclic beta-1,2-glucan synthetase
MFPAGTFDADALRASSDEQVLRVEALGIVHLEDLARRLAELHGLGDVRLAVGDLAGRFEKNREFLDALYHELAVLHRSGEPLPAGAEWLLDNHQVVDAQLRDLHSYLPHHCYRELPKLHDGVPRVYALALELITHADGLVDEETIVRFLRAYQSVAPLTIAEAWGVPIMLRVVLIDVLRRLAAQYAVSLRCRREAARMLDAFRTDNRFAFPSNDKQAAARTTRSKPANVPLDFADVRPHGFVESAAKRPAWQADAPLLFALATAAAHDDLCGERVLEQLEVIADRHDATLEEILRAEQRAQAADQVTISNVLATMRLLGSLDWTAFFERVNPAELALRDDPVGLYTALDAETRDRYRHTIEDIAERADVLDVDVARAALKLASEKHTAANSTVGMLDSEPAWHVGYYIIGPGLTELETGVGFRPSIVRRAGRALLRQPSACYIGGIGILTALLTASAVSAASQAGAGFVIIALVAILTILPAAEFAVGLLNFLVTKCIKPRPLPKLAFKQGIPNECATIVVIPTMLRSPRDAANLLERLETHYLANPEKNVRYALLTDFGDAPTQHLPGDAAAVEAAVAGIRRLNARYQTTDQGSFYLFHRGRRWNECEGVWMGWERKRGKLTEFNRLLRGEGAGTYEVQEGDLARLKNIRFVITLDTDSQMPHGVARRLVGTLAHPLNRPQLDATKSRVVSGYAMLQPRIGITLMSASKSLFARTFAGNAGLDPYNSATSDAYQDFFHEGSFTGKGIYDLEAFHATTDTTFPENQILSHDLIEGCHARVGLTSDIELIDDYPARYDADARRHHRWARGDWQLLQWLLPTVPTADGRRRNPLSLLSRWKIIDNLRRSLTAAALIAFIVAGWFILPGSPLLWTLAALAVAAFPLFTQLPALIPGHVFLLSPPQWFAATKRMIASALLQNFLTVAFLPHKAYYSLDAVVRSLHRTYVSRRKLLEWETAAAAEQRLVSRKWSFVVEMWFGPALAIGTFTAAAFGALPAAAFVPSLALSTVWLLSPLVAAWVSRPTKSTLVAPTSADKQYLREIAHRTWKYFETVVGPEDNFLPPDNISEHPVLGVDGLKQGALKNVTTKVAHRLSPTNEGLYLLSALAACDLGFIGPSELADRAETNLASWEKLTQFRGHHFNWYDTRTLKPLEPRYVSTVDSGNLVACFYTLARGFEEFAARPLGRPAQDRFTNETALTTEAARFLPWCELLKDTETDPATITARDIVRCCDAWADLALKLGGEHTLRTVANLTSHAADDFTSLGYELAEMHLPEAEAIAAMAWLRKLDEAVAMASANAQQLLSRFAALAERVTHLADEVDFSFLYDPNRKLFHIGFNFETETLDRGHYDLLASECRLTSLVTVARGEVDHRHWFNLGRGFTRAKGKQVLLSWSGSLFEHFMPTLFTKTYTNSLIESSLRAATEAQIAYCREQGVPWGISESSFAVVNSSNDYSYQGFGIPSLGLKRGLASDLVVSPYSTIMTLGLDAPRAVANMQDLEQEGALGALGYYDAVDYTPDRLAVDGQTVDEDALEASVDGTTADEPKPVAEIVKSRLARSHQLRGQIVPCYMSHHQGMSLLAIANCLADDCMQRRFHSHPSIRASEMLLQERDPIGARLAGPPVSLSADAERHAVRIPVIQTRADLVCRRITAADTSTTHAHWISNGRYTTVVNNADGGYSTCGDRDVTRRRSGAADDHGGQTIYLRDKNTDEVWSTAFRPTRKKADEYEVTYSIDKATFRRRDGEIETELQVTVAPEHDVELRLLTLTNYGLHTAEIEITSFVELADDYAAERFESGRFLNRRASLPGTSPIEMEILAERSGIVGGATKRGSSRSPCLFHTLAKSIVRRDGERSELVAARMEFETDRSRFMGRDGAMHSPAAMQPGARLSGRSEPVYDPIFSIRETLTIAPGETVSVAYVTGSAASRDEALRLMVDFGDLRIVRRAFELAWVHSCAELRRLRMTAAAAHLQQRIAPFVLPQEAAPVVAEPQEQAKRFELLRRCGIHGERRLMLVRVTQPEHLSLVRELLSARRYWRSLGLSVDLAILHGAASLGTASPADAGLSAALALTVRSFDGPAAESGAGVFLIDGVQLTDGELTMLEASVTAVFDGERGDMAKHLEAFHAPTSAGVKIRRGRATAYQG